MPKRVLVPALGAVAVVAGWAYLTFSWVAATMLVVACITLLAVVALAADWESHPDFEAREAVRAQRRREKWERNAGTRAKDRARWAAHQARQAQKQRQR